ncbi:hypothetical protein [Prevotella pallens]|uniref:hypothetical protein n=1 Tax=Prevotella pallens TaxID=60133 RepID=UPI001CADB180|nr:hypothetical protein [Prevotella pallens]MBF1478660.1 hypothetical protein [Prevotella pallens]
MWKHIFGYGNTRFCLRKDTGAMNRSPTPNGMFATNFVGVRHVIAIRSSRISCVFVAHSLLEYDVFVK